MNNSIVIRVVMDGSQAVLVIVGLCMICALIFVEKLNERFVASSEFLSTLTLSRGIPVTYFEKMLTLGFTEQNISAVVHKAPSSQMPQMFHWSFHYLNYTVDL